MLPRRNRVAPPASASMLNALLAGALPSHPTILLYGPSKIGKTLTTAYESAMLAKYNSARVEYIFFESNVEVEDIERVAGTCIALSVPCRVVKSDTYSITETYVKALSRGTRTPRGASLALWDEPPRVVTIDSLTALSQMILVKLNAERERGGPQFKIAEFNVHQNALLDPLRRAMSNARLAGYILMTSHETATIGAEYAPGVSAKPRYVSIAKFMEDAEVYVTRAGELGCRSRGDERRAAVVVRARRQNLVGSRVSYVLGVETVDAEFERAYVIGENYIVVDVAPPGYSLAEHVDYSKFNNVVELGEPEKVREEVQRVIVKSIKTCE